MYAIARAGGDVARRFASVAVLALATAAIAFPVKTVSGDDPTLLPYVTVVVADDLSDPANPATSLTIDFDSTFACSRGDYNAYISNWLDDF